MTVDAGSGGKILSFRHRDSEVISQLKWPESFGSTFWTSPQKEWNWPPVAEFDKQPYTVDATESRLVLTSHVSEKLGFRVRKAFTAGGKGPNQSIVVTYSIVNESGESRKVAPWEITRVPNREGIIFFDAPVDSITPGNLMKFQPLYGASWYQADETAENRKINADGKGWLAYAGDGLLLVKCFDDLNPSQPAPGEAEIQVYVNRGKTYIELESQGAYTTLQPGEELSWSVRWYLQPLAGEASPSSQLLEQVRKIAGNVRIFGGQ